LNYRHIIQPVILFLRRLFTAVKGEGAYLNQRKSCSAMKSSRPACWAPISQSVKRSQNPNIHILGFTRRSHGGGEMDLAAQGPRIGRCGVRRILEFGALRDHGGRVFVWSKLGSRNSL